MNNPMSLEGKHIIVTGASSGIGRAVCIQASELGAKVSLIARNEEKLKETITLMSGTSHYSYSYDLNNLEGVDSLIQQTVSDNGNIDGLVHCAGIAVNKPLKYMKPDFVQDIMKLSYFAFVELVRCSTIKKRANMGASFVGISSTGSLRGGKTQGAYAASKGAMNSLVKPLAKELAVNGMRINTIAFGMVNTDMYIKSFLEVGGNNDDLLKEQYLGVIDPQNAAMAACFMLSEASKYMTGGTLNYDGGCLS